MRKVLFATTALATVAGFSAVASADVTISGAQEWRYTSVSDDVTNRSSDSEFSADSDITISFSTTTDSGLTMSLSHNTGDAGEGTTTSSISADFGTITVSEGDTSAHAAGSYDVTSVGIAGGHGDIGFDFMSQSSGAGTAVTTVEIDEAQIDDDSSGAVIMYHSPTFGGFNFGIGTSHLANENDNSSMSYGAKYAGSAGDVSYTVGYAAYDGQGSDEEGSHIGANVSWDAITFGIGSSTNKDSATDEKETLSYSVNYAVNDSMIINIGQSNSENDAASTKYEASNTTIGVQYTIAPGLKAALSSHNFEYKSGGSVNNDGQAVQAEIKMSF